MTFIVLLQFTHFSCFGKKSAKRSRLKEALRANRALLKNPPAASPILQNRIDRAARAEPPPTVRCCAVTVTSMERTADAKCARVGYIGEGV